MKAVLFLVLSVTALSCSAQNHQRSGYYTKNGTYVAPSYATNPNNTVMDNYSTKGNTNPYTGKAGTVDPYRYTPPKSTAEPLFRPAEPLKF